MKGSEALRILKAAKIEVKDLGFGYVQARISSQISIKFNLNHSLPSAIEEVVRGISKLA